MYEKNFLFTKKVSKLLSNLKKEEKNLFYGIATFTKIIIIKKLVKISTTYHSHYFFSNILCLE